MNFDWEVRRKLRTAGLTAANQDLTNSGRPPLDTPGIAFFEDWVYLMFHALGMLAADYRLGRVRSMYYPDAVFCHVRHDRSDIVAEAAEIYMGVRESRGLGVPVFVDGTEGEARGGSEPGVIFAGFSVWRQDLLDSGVEETDIRPTAPAYNTPEEHAECVRLARENRWDTVAVVGHPAQMLRIALGLLAEMKKQSYWFAAYFATPWTMSWVTNTRGSQTAPPKERFAQFDTEFWRIPTYQAKGDLCSLEELVMYLHSGRDNIQDGRMMEPPALGGHLAGVPD